LKRQMKALDLPGKLR